MWYMILSARSLKFVYSRVCVRSIGMIRVMSDH